MLNKRVYQYIPLLTFLIATAILLYWGLGERSLWESEDRWAEITRNMLHTGDFFHPIINADIYFDKPLLSYWFIAAVATITGNLNEWATRVPSVIAGIIALFATFHLGRELWSKPVGWLACWILLTSYGFLFWSRTASADMANMTAIIVAIAWFFANKNKTTLLSYFIFYFICVIGAQTKGLTAIVIPALIILPYICREKRWRIHCNLSHLIALGLAILLYFIPFVIALKIPLVDGYHASNEQLNGINLVYRENILRFFKPFDHQGSLFTYIYALPYILVPWSPLFCIALYFNLTRVKKLTKNNRWLLEVIVLIFIFFTISGSRRWYYILPITPFCALLTSEFLIDINNQIPKKYCLLLIKSIFIIISLIFLVSPLLWKFTGNYQFDPPTSLIYSTFIIGFLGCFIFFINSLNPTVFSKIIDVNKQYAVIVIGSAILLGGWFCGQQPSLETLRPHKGFAEKIKEMAVDSTHIAFYEHIPPSMAFYLNYGKPISIIKETNVVSAIKNDSKVIIITEKNKLLTLTKFLSCQYQTRTLAEEADYPWDNNRKNKKLIAIQLYEIFNTDSACQAPADLSKPKQINSTHESDDFN